MGFSPYKDQIEQIRVFEIPIFVKFPYKSGCSWDYPLFTFHFDKKKHSTKIFTSKLGPNASKPK